MKLAHGQASEHGGDIALYGKVPAQKRSDRNKTYSLHKPFTACMAKGEAHKQYEFGNKVGLTLTSRSLIITAIKTFEGNPHDGKTLEPLLDQIKANRLHTPKVIVYDRGGKGIERIGETVISTPDNRPLKRDTEYQRRAKRKKFRRGAAIMPVIGHLKTDFRMGQNYLYGKRSPQINTFLAATGWSMKKMMKKLKEEFDKTSLPDFKTSPLFSNEPKSSLLRIDYITW